MASGGGGDYITWSVPALKKELSLRGAVTRGRKTYLIERLNAYDRNKNFQEEPVILPEPLDVGWPVSGFRQLLAEHKMVLPKITKEQIDAYFVYRLAGDKQCAADIKALTKGQLMYDSNRVQACSINFKDTNIFLSGIVGAAMKQKVSYNYKIRLDKKTGDPLNSHCECPAGRGPHGTCKHLAAVFLMMEDFVNNGALKVEKTCTENLQMFNKPKSTYHGSPVKAELLPTKRKLCDEFLNDPRPLKYRNDNTFNYRVRNLMLNYCSQTSKDLSIRYLYSKADIQAAAIEHNYSTIPFTEHWVDHAVEVDAKMAQKIEQMTRGQSVSSAWYQAREWRLTASRFGEICKATCRRNTTKLCASLTGRNTFSTQATLHGKNYEKKALNAFQSNSTLQTTTCGLFVSVEHPYLGATPDATVGEDGLVEIKCPFNGRNEKIKPGKCFPFLKYDDNGNTVLKQSSNYYVQIQGQLYVSKREYCYFVVYTFCDLFVQKIAIDNAYCESCLIPKLEVFYKKFFRPYIASQM
ncbi:uncharacterized protein [Mytilus edulis]|uniref:uncharacterized protein n=1 Tax=Mytilus edulis TaxID=6550 RepID=UPI0039EDEF25